ncbi:MAG TPA: cytochrome c-type biogenesis protein [Acetobacteraceae bacterium]|nr:cytochrome c-type biogenesis protein [Acetobacteraceae bacterium]
MISRRRRTKAGSATRKIWLPIVAIGFLLAAHALAVEPSERLANPALEARARAISAGLRCLVCQNESIDDSQAGLAHDIRMLVRRRLSAGDTDAQTIQAVVARYGDFVLLKPPVEPATYLLWFGPAALLGIGLAGIAVWLRRRPATVEAATPLNQMERERLDKLMNEGQG